MLSTPNIQSLDVHDGRNDPSTLGERWKKWINRFENFIIAANITEEERKRAMLLHLIGENAFDLYQSLPDPTPQTPPLEPYALAKHKLDIETTQELSETVGQFYARLLKLAQTCNFHDTDSEIKSQIILKTHNKELRRYGLTEQPDLSKLLLKARALETTDTQIVKIENKDNETHTLSLLQINDLQSNDRRIFPYNTPHTLKVLGKFQGIFKTEKTRTTAEVIVVEGHGEPLLSYETSVQLKLVEVKCRNIKDMTNIQYLEKKYPELCKGIGNLKNYQVKLHIDNTVTPVAQTNRRIPFHLRNKVEIELNRLLMEGIIEKATEPTNWISPAVIVPKPHDPVSPTVIVPKPHDPDAIRLCIDMRAANKAIKRVDMRAANKAIKRVRNITPTTDDIITQLNGAKVFSKIDLKEGYHQLTLAEESRHITAFATHIGIFRYKRLNFGINTAAEIFQDSKWTWTKQHQAEYNKVKDLVIKSSKLTYFKVNETTHLHVDAGPKGLGAILSQGNHPKRNITAFASRSLSLAEQKYSHIEKEMLAISWAIRHFSIYLTGHQFIIYTDHKPLVNILENPRTAPSARIERLCLKIQQRLCLKIQHHQFKVVYQEGKTNPSDYLSRHPVIAEIHDEIKTENYVNFIIQRNMPKKLTVQEVAKETETDPVLKQNQNANAWEKPDIRQFKNVKDELTLGQSIILRGHRIIIPRSLQQRTIKLAHLGHQGIVKTKQLLRSKVWFPNIDKLTEQEIRKCIACQATDESKYKAPLQLRETPNQPFIKLDIDYAGPFQNNKYAVLLVDEYSRYPFIEMINSTKFIDLKPVLQKIFSL
ncbi:RNase H-like domain found in reverse transcriptase [Popillia japonica]|uniref:RNA-directed DNA polymerase n=1 Tax=Popillia japonica TaxID=7064 RepID=A0AAW1JI31_POPJA